MNEKDFAAALDKALQGAAKHSAPEPTGPYDADDLVIALAERFNENSEEVLEELRGSNALARLCRKILGVNLRPPFGRDEHIFLTCQSLRHKGWQGDSLYEEAARRLNDEPTPVAPVGRRPRPIGPGSVKTQALRGKQNLQARLGLAALFLDIG